MSIRITDVTKRFGNFTALDNVSLEVPERFACWRLLGPSGSGKTTLLRIIAGLETADSGTFSYQDEDVTDHSARDRNVGFVFQHYALFRHMNVFENIAFGLRVRDRERRESIEAGARTAAACAAGGLGAPLSRRSSPAANGSASALARALAIQPEVLLLDEPFGALDAKVRQELRQWLRRLHDEIHMTSVFVTHDQEEAFEVADHVVVMNDGRDRTDRHAARSLRAPGQRVRHGFSRQCQRVPRPSAKWPGHMGGVEVAYPDIPTQESGRPRCYVRPHELEIEHVPNGVASLKAARCKNQPGRFGRQSVFDGNRLRPGVQRRDQSRAECRIGTEDGRYRICFSAQGASVRARVRNLTANLPSLFCKS